MQTHVTEILEYINIAITLLFLFFYIYRLIHLRHFAVTERYRSKHPKARIVLCGIYVLLSIPFLILSIYYGVHEGSPDQFWDIEEGIGELVDAIILIIQLLVLKAELSKQRPYTAIHIIFSIYLTCISLARFVVVLIYYLQYSPVNYQTLGFYLAFLINAVMILGYWIAKRQELPQFEDNKYFSFDEFQAHNSSKYLMSRNIQISYLRKISQNFHYIRPTVSVQKSRFRIVLQIYEQPQRDEMTEMVDRSSSMSARRKTATRNLQFENNLKVISNNLYNTTQILDLYRICGRFDLKQKLNFDAGLGEMYKNLQHYLEELFANKNYYLDFVLSFFDVGQDVKSRYDRELRMTLKGSQWDIQANMDGNATIISVKIYKQLWMDDHYLFYIDIVAVDGTFDCRPMKRYSDFQQFHQNLQGIIKRRYGKHCLPELPKKYLFNWDESKITQRRHQLESYLRNICNDHELMLNMPQLKKAVLKFLTCPEKTKVTAHTDHAIDFLKNLQVMKGAITKHLVNSEYVTYYEFKLLKNGLPIRTIKKRFNDFVALHEALERWQTNTQVYYKFISLPEKHLYKSGPIRHQKLKIYLSSLINIPDIWKIYTFLWFIHLDSKITDIDISDINLQNSLFMNSPNMVQDSHDEQQVRTKGLIDQNSLSSNQRMSALIDELGG